MARPHRWPLGLGLVGAAALLVVAARWSSPEAPRAAPSDACRFVAGDALTYDFELAGATDLDPGAVAGGRGAASRVEVLVHGRLDLEVRTVRAGTARLQGFFEAEGQAPLRFGLDLTSRCEVSKVGLADEAPASTSARLRTLLALATVHIEAGEAWQAQHEDGVGVARFAYARRASGSVTRRKLTYARLHEAAMEAKVLSSDARLELAEDGRWLERVVATERIELTSQGRILQRATTQLVLRKRVRPVGLARQDPGLRWAGLGAPRPRPPPAPPARSGPALDPRGLLEALRAYHDGEDLDGAYELMLAQLAESPALRDALSARLASSELEALDAELFLLALRDLEDEPRLVELARSALGEANLARTFYALAKLEAPGSEAVAALLDRSAQLDDVGRSAHLALGVATARLQGDLRRRSLDALRAGLTSPAPGRAGAALSAVGNSGAPELFDAVVPWLDAESPLSRGKAASALRKMPGAAAGEALERLSLNDPDPHARRRAVQALRERAERGVGPLDDAARQRLLDRVAVEPDPEVRRGLIVSAARGASPERLAQLAAWFHREPDPGLRQRIGTFVGADALAAAR